MIQTTLMRMPQVVKTCGLKKSAIYLKIKAGDFPSAVKLGPKSVAWRSDEIEGWIASRPKVNLNHTREEEVTA